MSKTQEPSKAEILASVVSGIAETINVESVRAVSYRVPVRLLARVDALASKSKKSRNFILSELVEIGLDETFVLLDQADIEELMSREMHNLQQLLDGAEVESSINGEG